MAEIPKNLLAVLILLVIVISLVSTYFAMMGGMNLNFMKKTDSNSGTVRLTILDKPASEEQTATVRLVIVPSEAEGAK